MTKLRRAAIVSPLRTAVGKFQGGLSSMQAGDLGAVVLKALVERTKIDPERIDDVVFAQGYASGEAPCVARWSALAADLPDHGARLPARPPLRIGPAGDHRRRHVRADRRGRRRRRRRRREHEQRRILHDRHAQRRAHGLRDDARPARPRSRDVPADLPLRRHHRHDRDRREPRQGLPDQREACDEYAAASHQRAAAAWKAGKFDERTRAGLCPAEEGRSGRLQAGRGRARRCDAAVARRS